MQVGLWRAGRFGGYEAGGSGNSLRGKRPTLDDVAHVSGVARVTASRVLNGGPNVRPEVREKVLRAVAELDYRVNEQARGLAGGRSRLVTLVFASDLQAQPNSFWEAGLELGALRACTQLGFQLTTQRVVNNKRGRDMVRDLIEQGQSEGVILTPPHSDDRELLEWIAERNCALVCVAPGGAEGRAVASVGIDDEQAAYDLAVYLLELGHQRFAFIGGLAGHHSAERRLLGLRRALAERGMEDRIIVVRGDFTFKAGADLAPEVLKGPNAPTALVCANDDMAIGALLAAHRLGVAVPDEVSITGFDDTPVSSVVWPPLTTVHQPITEMGAQAVELMVDQLHNRLKQGGGFRQLAHSLVVRASAAKAPH